jgi:DNA-binding LacI/PurR family transcriptional regulator
MLVNVPRVTSFDVAKLAGVSQPTVSRALRNLPGTSPETRERVRAAARELAYIPSDRGRALSLQRTHRIAVVVEELTNPYYPELVEPLRRELSPHGYQVVLVSDAPKSDRLAATLADGSYDGVVLTTTTRRSTLPSELTEAQVPHVLVNRVLDSPDSPSCAADNHGGAALVARLLADLGHVRIATIQGPANTSTGMQRAQGLRVGLARHDLRIPRNLFVRAPFTHEAGADAALRLLSISPRPTAVVCGNDVLAFGAMSAAKSLGLDIPGDLTIVGFDDIPLAGWPIVSLTTVRCDLSQLAHRSVKLLTEQLEGAPIQGQLQLVEPVLVERGTHGPPAASNTVPARSN